MIFLCLRMETGSILAIIFLLSFIFGQFVFFIVTWFIAIYLNVYKYLYFNKELYSNRKSEQQFWLKPFFYVSKYIDWLGHLIYGLSCFVFGI
jgi:hypothetical protein